MSWSAKFFKSTAKAWVENMGPTTKHFIQSAKESALTSLNQGNYQKFIQSINNLKIHFNDTLAPDAITAFIDVMRVFNRQTLQILAGSSRDPKALSAIQITPEAFQIYQIREKAKAMTAIIPEPHP